jgi:hypothetical protein
MIPIVKEGLEGEQGRLGAPFGELGVPKGELGVPLGDKGQGGERGAGIRDQKNCPSSQYTTPNTHYPFIQELYQWSFGYNDF